MTTPGGGRAWRWLRAAGLCVSAIAVVAIVVAFVRGHALDTLRQAAIPPGELALLVAGCAVGYAIAMLLPGFAWWQWLTSLSPRRPGVVPVVASYAVTQYGKYLPGNVAHYALRHAWSRRHAIAHAALGLATILEALLLLVAAATLTLLADARRFALLSFVEPPIAIALLVAMIAVLGVALRWANRRDVLRRFDVPALPPLVVMLSCLAMYGAFFVACAALVFTLAHALGIGVDSFAMLLGATAASWLAGFVVIGAPGGLGVREAAFVALAGAALGEERALVVISLFRVVTFLGDTLFFAAGALAMRASARAAATD
jgi:glycosyltransferase 2 family protein